MAQNLYVGKTVPGSTVTVYWAGTTVKPTINVSDGGSAASNPITANTNDGSYAFWVSDGNYKIVNGYTADGVTASDITSIRFSQANQEGSPHAKDIAVSKYRSSTATTLEAWLQNFQNTPTFDGAATFSSTVSVTDATAATTTTAASVMLAGGLSAVKNCYLGADLFQASANGAKIQFFQLSEEVTLSTSGTTTDSTANLLPANSFIAGVVARVTTTITTATDWKLGDPTTAGRFTAAKATMTAGTTDVGLIHLSGASTTLAAGPSQVSAAKVRITTTGTPGAGKIRITTFGWTLTPPTS